MAANGVKDFFPFLTQTVASNSGLSRFLDFILPDSPYIPALHLKGLTSESIVLKYPLLAAVIVAGFIVCFDGGRRLLRLTGTTHHFKGSFSWGMAMLWYAFMCFGGFWYHSINHGRFFYKVDVTGTACSSLSIVVGSLGLDDRIPVNRRILWAVYLMATVGAFFGSQLMKELLYLLPTAAAFLAGFVFCVKMVVAEFGGESRREEEKEKKRKAEIGWYLVVAGFGAGSGLVGLVFSRWIMETMGPNFHPIFWFFFGCEVALWGLVRSVVSANDVGFLVLKVLLQMGAPVIFFLATTALLRFAFYSRHKKMAANSIMDFFPSLTRAAAPNSALSHFFYFILPDSPYIPALHLKASPSYSSCFSNEQNHTDQRKHG